MYCDFCQMKHFSVSGRKLLIATEARCAAMEALFALQQTRMAEATCAWQAATGKRDVLPDLGDLLAWLMDRPAALEAQVRELEERCHGYLEIEVQLNTGKCALEAQVQELRQAVVKLVLPYEALLLDNESRRWLAPTLWVAIEEGVKAVRAALARRDGDAEAKEEDA